MTTTRILQVTDLHLFADPTERLNGAIGLGELIVGVIARDDDVIQMLP